MSTLDELERSIERLNRAVERLSGGMGKYGFANVYNDDVQLLLSERAELLAAVEGMRAMLSGIKWRSIDRDNMEFSATITCWQMDAIRAALTTGEATTPNAGEKG